MEDGMPMGIPLDSVAHIIQVALTPVFLLSGVGTLLNVITVRLGRVADQFDLACDALRDAGRDEAMIQREAVMVIRRRLAALDAARLFAALAGALTCAATFTLFLGALQNTVIATALFLSFGGAVLCTMAALICYLAEALLSSRRRVPDVVGAFGSAAIRGTRGSTSAEMGGEAASFGQDSGGQ